MNHFSTEFRRAQIDRKENQIKHMLHGFAIIIYVMKNSLLIDRCGKHRYWRWHVAAGLEKWSNRKSEAKNKQNGRGFTVYKRLKIKDFH